MSTALYYMAGLTIGLLFIDFIVEYRAYKKRKANGEKGKFLQWL